MYTIITNVHNKENGEAMYYLFNYSINLKVYLVLMTMMMMMMGFINYHKAQNAWSTPKACPNILP